jgi:hypothetical protein
MFNILSHYPAFRPSVHLSYKRYPPFTHIVNSVFTLIFSQIMRMPTVITRCLIVIFNHKLYISTGEKTTQIKGDWNEIIYNVVKRIKITPTY